jgi:hypothetical protein
MTAVKIPNRLVLRIPTIILLRASYAWIFIVAFYAWPPVLSGILTALLLISLILLKAQHTTWEKLITQSHLGTGPVRYVDHPKPPLRYLILNLFVALLIGGSAAFVLDGRAYLSDLQWFLIIAGPIFLNQSVMLFWVPMTYLITDQGIWILYLTSRLFIRFKEVAQAQVVQSHVAPIGQDFMLTPVKYPAALRLRPVNRSGFTRLVRELLLTPTDLDALLRQIPPELIRTVGK